MNLKSIYLNYVFIFYKLPLTLAYLLEPSLYSIRNAKISLGYPQDSLLNFTELAAKYKYVSEEHKVITEDGYILTIFRITKARNCFGKIRSPPVILMHGLLLSSDSWIDSGPNSGLAYLISDACYDLWLGNNRGNYYSRSHVRLNPDRDPEFWNFDYEAMGTYDIPAIIDYILNYTTSKKLNYIGYSQGSGVFFVMCSEKIGYCDKVQLMISLAPISRTLNTKSSFFRGLLESLGKTVTDGNGPQEVLSKGSFLQEFVAYFCQNTDLNTRLCELFIEIFDHVDSLNLGSKSIMTIKVLFGHFPAGTSLYNMAKHSQDIKSDQFQKFNYGKDRNLVMYGSEQPPAYNLSAVTVPVVCIYGKNDGLVDTKDVKWLISKLPNVINLIEVENPLWTHLDMAYSQYTKKSIFPKISEYLSKYSYNNC